MTEELKIIISAEVDKLKTAVNNAKKEVEDFAKKGKEKFKGFNEEVQKAGDISKKALAVTAASIAGAATALLALGNSTAEFRKNQAQLNSAFEQANLSASNAKSVYKELFGVIGDDDQAVESAANIAMLANSEKEATKWAELAAGVVGTFHDTLQPEAFYEAANETLKLGEASGAFTQMLEQTGVMSVEKFNDKMAKCTTEAQKQALMLSVTEKAVGKAGKSYKENAKDIIKQNEAQAKMNEQMAKLGETMAPINTMLAAFATEALAKITPYIQEFAAEHGPAIKKTLEEVATAIGNVIKWIADNWELVSTLATIILGVAAALSVFSTAMGIVNAVMAASPVTWIVLGIVAALAAVIAIVVLVIKHWDEIKEATTKTFEKIKEAVSTAIDAVVGIFEKIINWVKDNWQGLLLLILNPFAGAFKLVYDNCEGFRNFVNDFISKVKNGFKNGFEAVKNFIVNPIVNAKNKVTETFTNIKNGALQKIEELKNKVKDIVETIKGFFDFEFKTPKIKKPQFGITPSGWKVDDLLKGVIPKLSVKWNAQGGVFDRPTIVPYGNTLQGLGEAGAEAIVPLEKNTEWLDKIAEKLSAKQSSTPVVLNVDGKVFAQTAINTINENTKQTGSLKLNIM